MKLRGLIQITCLGVVAVLIAAVFVLPQPAHAASAADWNPGRIIDDEIFQNKSAMSVAQIQQFLDAKVPVCDRNGTSQIYDPSYGDTVSRATYSARRGVTAPFTCLKEYVENPTTKENNVGRPTYQVPGGLSAAQLIYNAAQAQNINPQVFLVLLQKEQSLVTDDWPWPVQFERATGNNCPDTAPCNPVFAWLWTQVNNSGAQFNYYVDHFDEYNYAPGWNNILLSPNAACGTQQVYIYNRFTAALYIYTPYTPNTAALTNMYGTGDQCSSYGNRNFWRLFTDWFGSTKSTPFIANSGRVYMLGANRTYYYVPNQALLNAYGFGAKFGYIDTVDSEYMATLTSAGTLTRVARFEEPAIYAITTNGGARFPDQLTYESYGYSFGQEVVLPSHLRYYYPEFTTMSTVAKTSDKSDVYAVEGGKRRHISSKAAFDTLGTPLYNTRPLSVLPSEYLNSFTLGAPIITGPTMLAASDTTYTAIYADGTAYRLDASIATDWALSLPSYKTTSASLMQLPQGADLGRFVKTLANQTYLIDDGRSLSIDATTKTALGLQDSLFTVIPTTIIAGTTDRAMTPLFKSSTDAAVYAAQDGIAHRIASSDDLLGLGYSWAELTTVKQGNFSMLPKDARVLYKSGRLLQTPVDKEVYVVDGQLQKRHIPSEAIMLAFGFDFRNIRNDSATNIATNTTTSALSRLVKDEGGSHWLIDNRNRWAFDPQLMADFGYTAGGFTAVHDELLTYTTERGPLSRAIKTSDRPEVYVVDDGQKHWASSVAVLNSAGYNLSQVQVVSTSFLSELSTGTAL